MLKGVRCPTQAQPKITAFRATASQGRTHNHQVAAGGQIERQHVAGMRRLGHQRPPAVAMLRPPEEKAQKGR